MAVHEDERWGFGGKGKGLSTFEWRPVADDGARSVWFYQRGRQRGGCGAAQDEGGIHALSDEFLAVKIGEDVFSQVGCQGAGHAEPGDGDRGICRRPAAFQGIVSREQLLIGRRLVFHLVDGVQAGEAYAEDRAGFVVVIHECDGGWITQ